MLGEWLGVVGEVSRRLIEEPVYLLHTKSLEEGRQCYTPNRVYAVKGYTEACLADGLGIYASCTEDGLDVLL